jgi:ABC-2 type transport system ATP-binding protein
MEAADAIYVSGLCKSYGTVDAVRGIDFHVGPGEVFGLLGPNGAGKTTTVEILEGLRPRTDGTVRVLGFDPATQTRQLKERIGVCLQATNLPDKMKVWEALELFGAFYPRQIDARNLLERLQLWEKRDAFYSTLSGGQKQRVALALGLVNDPLLLFLDEPTTGLDPQVRHEIHNLILELKQDRRTIVLTTHYIEEAERLCDRVAIIDQGRIMESGTPREIQERTLVHSTVEVEMSGTIESGDLPDWLASHRHAISDSRKSISFQSPNPARTISELLRWMDTRQLELVDIQLKRPTLEDVFIELTGRKLRE